MKILLSPAKSIQLNQDYPTVSVSVPDLLSESEKLIQKLKKYSPKKLAELFSVSKDIAELNYNRFQHWETPVTSTENNMPAVFAFTGDVYRGLDVKSLDSKQLTYINEHVRILSGLYGILKPFDLLYPYRLEMGTRLNYSSKIKNLYQFWGDKISEIINTEETEYIINLASAEYYKVIQEKKTTAKIITPVFKETKNGEYKVVMTYAKLARGEMARYCAQNMVQHPEELKKFNVSHYQFRDELSTDTEFVFAR